MKLKKIEKCIVRYLTREATITDLDFLSEWIKNPDNEKVFDDFIKIYYEVTIIMSKPDVDLIKKNLVKKIKKDKNPFVRHLKVFKYVAAIIVGVLATSYFFKDSLFNNSLLPTPTIVNTTIIKPGTDKATLTLSDGSQIALEKGNAFQTQNADSNGEKITYQKNAKNTQKIAYNYLTIPRGGQFHIVLSDSTEVWLNSESQLKYPVHFIEGKTREVELVYGEAYFNVSSSTSHNGAKFKVINNAQDVEVLGTEFNIKAYKGETNIYTTLVEGKVEINTSTDKQFLIPNQQSNLDIINNNLLISIVDVNAEISWKNGLFSFKGKPLNEIMKVISRWYDVNVIFENKDLKNITFKGVLGKNQKIEDILLTIKTLSIIKDFEIKNNVIILK